MPLPPDRPLPAASLAPPALADLLLAGDGGLSHDAYWRTSARPLLAHLLTVQPYAAWRRAARDGSLADQLQAAVAAPGDGQLTPQAIADLLSYAEEVRHTLLAIVRNALVRDPLEGLVGPDGAWLPTPAEQAAAARERNELDALALEAYQEEQRRALVRARRRHWGRTAIALLGIASGAVALAAGVLALSGPLAAGICLFGVAGIGGYAVGKVDVTHVPSICPPEC